MGHSASESANLGWQDALKNAEFSIGVLTLSRHRADVWITTLVDRLQTQAPKASIEILDVETAPMSLGFGHEGGAKPNWELLVNRVSDAAAPAMVKAALMFLRAAELEGCCVVNGVSAYSTGVSKALHHVALHRAGLCTPATMVCRALPLKEPDLSRLTFPILLKPNSGGFGAGISKFERREELEAAVQGGDVGLGGEGVALLQNYVEPAGGAVYRVWVAGRRVQCAVQAVGPGAACMAGACQRGANKRHRIQAWDPPPDVADGVVAVMAACGADCGSVELLYPEAAPPREGGEAGGDTPQPLFFDVNMLSTLPQPGQVDDPESLWPDSYDPWAELAKHMLHKLVEHGLLPR